MPSFHEAADEGCVPVDAGMESDNGGGAVARGLPVVEPGVVTHDSLARSSQHAHAQGWLAEDLAPKIPARSVARPSSPSDEGGTSGAAHPLAPSQDAQGQA